MTKITTDAQALAVLHGLIHVFETALDDRSETCRSLHAYLAARLASTSPAPDGWEVAGRAVLNISTDPDKDAYGNGWNDCLDIVFMAYLDAAVPVKAAAPQPVVEKDNG